MTWLAPWFLALGALGALGVVAAHLLARHRPPRAVLPTARFVPASRPVSSTRLSAPSDLALLALRALAVLVIAAAFARPTPLPARGSVARVVLLDRSGAVADPRAAGDSARAQLRAGDLLVPYDTSARSAVEMPDAEAALADTARAPVMASLSAALTAALRSGASLRARADSVELVVVSPMAPGSVDAATRGIRAAWPGRVRLVRVAERPRAAADSAVSMEATADDPLGATLALAGLAAGGEVGRRIVRSSPTAADSAWVREGTGRVLVAWPRTAGDVAPFARRARADIAGGVIARGEVVVAPFARTHELRGGQVVARWADGEPAATDTPLGAGCVRHVAIAIPGGDAPLRPSMLRLVRALAGPCALGGEDAAAARPGRAVDVTALFGDPRAPLATARALARVDGGPAARSRLVPWLLAAGALLLVAEMLLRDRARRAVSA